MIKIFYLDFLILSEEFFFESIFNSLPMDKSLDWTNLKSFADDKIYLIEKLKLVVERVENIMGKGENSSYKNFLLFP